MGCHPQVLESLVHKLSQARSREDQDKLLDRWVRLTTQATEWDAAMWHFEPFWMSEELAQLAGIHPRRRPSHL